MAKFKIGIFPAKRDNGFTSIAITNRLKTVTVEATLDTLHQTMLDAVQGVASNQPDLPGLHVSAYPEGRAPNGFKAFSAANKNQVYIEAQAIGVPALA